VGSVDMKTPQMMTISKAKYDFFHRPNGCLCSVLPLSVSGRSGMQGAEAAVVDDEYKQWRAIMSDGNHVCR